MKIVAGRLSIVSGTDPHWSISFLVQRRHLFTVSRYASGMSNNSYIHWYKPLLDNCMFATSVQLGRWYFGTYSLLMSDLFQFLGVTEDGFISLHGDHSIIG